MAKGKPVIYWDTSVLLSWIKGEIRPDRQMDGVEDVAKSIMANHCVMLTSVMTQTEVLESSLTPEASEKFKLLFQRRNCQMVATDRRIATLASELRNYYQLQKVVDGLPALSSPDATHLATAIHFEVSEFQTFDARDEPKKRRGLLPLNGNVAGHNLLIRMPPIPPLPANMPLF